MINIAVRKLRQYDEMTQLDLSKKLGIKKADVIRLESGDKPVGLWIMKKYSEIFDIPTEQIVFLSEYIRSKGKMADRFRRVFKGKITDIINWIDNK